MSSLPLVAARCLFCGVVATRFIRGRFPSNAPQPPGGQMKPKHDRTRPHCHPLPWVNPHSRAQVAGWHPALPAGKCRDGQGEAMLNMAASPDWFVLWGFVAAGICSQRKCILFIAESSWCRHETKAPSPSRHRYRLRVVHKNKKFVQDKPPCTGFFYFYTPP